MKPKATILYLLLFSVSIIVFLFVLFPQQQLAKVLSHALTNPKAGIYTNVDNVKPSLPFNLTLSDLSISIGPKTRIEPEAVKITLGPRLFLGENRQLRFKSALGNGQLKGRVGFQPSQPIVYTNAQLSLEGLTFDQLNYNTRLARMKLSGSVDAQFLHASQKEDQKDPDMERYRLKNFQQYSGTLF